jgi:hypothetical protein
VGIEKGLGMVGAVALVLCPGDADEPDLLASKSLWIPARNPLYFSNIALRSSVQSFSMVFWIVERRLSFSPRRDR